MKLLEEELKSNISINDIYDFHKLRNEIGAHEYVFETNDDYYTLRLSVDKFTSSIPKLMLLIELRDSNSNSCDVMPKVFVLDDFKSFLSNSINKFIAGVNSSKIKVVCFEKSDNLYIEDGKLFAKVYDFDNNKLYDTPIHKELTLQLNDISIDNMVTAAKIQYTVMDIPAELEKV